MRSSGSDIDKIVAMEKFRPAWRKWTGHFGAGVSSDADMTILIVRIAVKSFKWKVPTDDGPAVSKVGKLH